MSSHLILDLWNEPKNCSFLRALASKNEQFVASFINLISNGNEFEILFITWLKFEGILSSKRQENQRKCSFLSRFSRHEIVLFLPHCLNDVNVIIEYSKKTSANQNRADRVITRVTYWIYVMGLWHWITRYHVINSFTWRFFTHKEH